MLGTERFQRCNNLLQALAAPAGPWSVHVAEQRFTQVARVCRDSLSQPLPGYAPPSE